MAEPSVAVIVPLLNEMPILPTMADSWLKLDADELLIVDGGSVDGSREFLQASELYWLTSETGRARQMNAGAAASSADVLLFLHADTRLPDDALQAVRHALCDIGTVGGHFDVRIDSDEPVLRAVGWAMNRRSRLTGISTGDQVMFVRRDVFERLGGFPDQPLMEDIEFSKCLKREGRIACLSQRALTSARRWRKSGVAATILLMWRLRFLYWLGVSAERLSLMYRGVR